MQSVDRLPDFSGLTFTFNPQHPTMITVGNGEDKTRIKIYKSPDNRKIRFCIESNEVPVLITKEER